MKNKKIKSYKNIKNISYSNTKSIIKIGEKVFPVEEINKNYLNNFETSILDGKLTNGVVVEKWVANSYECKCRRYHKYKNNISK